MEIRDTIQSDLDYMADNSTSQGVQKACPEQLSYMYTLADDGVVLGTGGFRLINKHTAWCWVDMGPISKENIIVSYRVIKETIDKFCVDKDLSRLQAYVLCDFTTAIRMVQHLGFTKETTMKNFNGKQDAFLYAKVV